MGRERREFGSIRKLASGRHQAVYTGPDLLRHVAPTTFQAKIDAEGWLHEERKLIEANDWSPPKHRAEKARAAAKTPDFETYAKKWIAKRRTDKGEPLRASTRANYDATLEHHLVPTFGRMRLRDITKGAVRRWYEDTLEGNGDTPCPSERSTRPFLKPRNRGTEARPQGISPTSTKSIQREPTPSIPVWTWPIVATITIAVIGQSTDAWWAALADVAILGGSLAVILGAHSGYSRFVGIAVSVMLGQWRSVCLD